MEALGGVAVGMA